MSNRISTKRRAQSGSPVRSMKCYASVALMPKVNSAKCHDENRVFIHPVCALDGCRFMVNEGWRVLGWCDAPTKGAGPHAIVYEKLNPAIFDGPRFGRGSEHSTFEPGIYWGHGDAKNMQFCSTLPAELEDELGPWVRKHNDRTERPGDAEATNATGAIPPGSLK